ncbi:hypothetical protein [Chitinophaga rhizophila]|uniref:Uncharacterized protein n=1 Tax=Chitinophaga rhizophila TaxID=2866212 RepID=A0ABS7G941_9BACT|nr:hypothetical protein [Chitinophaga rhizophila]MBW8684173.1 hypothetical protein [Chitinophaga rhizophila]
MGLDWRPLGKPKPGCKDRFDQLFRILRGIDPIPVKPGTRKRFTREELKAEWFDIQIPSYETIQAPRVGRDQEADDWVKRLYEASEQSDTLEDWQRHYEGYYVIELAKETEGVPVYISETQDENVFRAKFIEVFCKELLGEALYNKAWETHTAEETLAYGKQLLEVADKLASTHNLCSLKDQQLPPDVEVGSLSSQVHILYSAARWLIFYGSNGHGFEADA